MSVTVSTTSRTRLGEVLTDLGLISEADLGQALASQRETRARLGETLVALGRISRAELALALAEQYRRSLAAAVGLSLLCLASPAQAEKTVSITLRGHVAARSAVQLASAEPAVFEDTTQPIRDGLLMQLSQRSNTRTSVTLEAASAKGGAAPALTDPTGGGRVPYQLTWQGAPLEFRSGEAVLKGAEARRGTSAGSGELRISTAATPAALRGFVSERLTLVVRAM